MNQVHIDKLKSSGSLVTNAFLSEIADAAEGIRVFTVSDCYLRSKIESDTADKIASKAVDCLQLSIS